MDADRLRGFCLGFNGAAGERKILAVVKRANSVLIEARLVNLEICTVQRIRRQFFDREANRIGCGVKSAIRESRTLLLTNGGRKQFCCFVVAECGHGY